MACAAVQQRRVSRAHDAIHLQAASARRRGQHEAAASTSTTSFERDGATVGREVELAAIDAALASLAAGPELVVFEGEAGIGKTRLLQEAAGRSRRLGY